MPLVTLTSGKTFQAEQGLSILDAASKAGISMPYSCKTGRCSSCKCKVVEGSSIAIHEETGLTAAEKAAGWILSCVRTMTSNLLLEAEDLGEVTLPTTKTFPCRINSIEKTTPDVLRITLRLPPTAEFNFIAGQYIDVIGPNGIRRSYSLANSNFDDKLLELHIKAVDGGAMSNYWFNQAKPNDLLRLNGPLGTFFLRDIAGLDLVFMATGTGIAPIKAMLETIDTLRQNEQPRSTTVLWGARHEQDLYFDFTKIKGMYRFLPTISRAKDQWQGARGYVQHVLISQFADLRNVAVYACGSETMIQSSKKLLTEAGLPNNRFYSDAFVCSAAL